MEEQASGAQAVVRAMDKMRELVQQSHVRFHRTLRCGRADVEDVAQPARHHGPLRPANDRAPFAQ